MVSMTSEMGKKFYVEDRGIELPIALGHEIVGKVAKVGPDAVSVAVGSCQISDHPLTCTVASLAHQRAIYTKL